MPSPSPALDPDDAPELSLIIPTRNDHADIATTLDAVRAAWSDLEILVVTDTNAPGSAAADARSYALTTDARVRLLDVPGDKATAVHAGFTAARGQAVAYLDADYGWEASPTDLCVAARQVLSGDTDCVAAQRDQHDWTRARKLKTNGFILATRLLFPRLPVRDTQAPLKVMTRTAAELVVDTASWRSWAFDVELLHLLHTTGLRVTALPVRWRGQGGEHSWASLILIVLMAPGMIRGLLTARLRTLKQHRGVLSRRGDIAGASRPQV
jgi:glycosyltransferase involved in cell wall biosynthesis